MKRTLWLLAAAGSLLGVGAGAATIGVGKTAPAWSGKTVQGKPISSAQYKGKVVLMNFFGFF
jgi:hypothetical protein